MASCRSCHKPIRWAKTQKGKLMPLDVDKRWDGNIRLLDTPQGPLVEVLNEEQRRRHRNACLSRGVSADLYVSHFVSCSNAQGHRRRA